MDTSTVFPYPASLGPFLTFLHLLEYNKALIELHCIVCVMFRKLMAG